ncbi:hypothetical protein CBL_13640 [Carabus blaptoides fortunei]
MKLHQATVVLLCLFLSSHGVLAVVNSKSATSSDSNSKSSSNVNNNAGSNESGDSVAASSEKETNRREIPVGGLSDSYGVPIPTEYRIYPFKEFLEVIPCKFNLLMVLADKMALPKMYLMNKCCQMVYYNPFWLQSNSLNSNKISHNNINLFKNTVIFSMRRQVLLFHIK